MPVTEEQLIQLIKSKGGTDEQINQARQRRILTGLTQQNRPGSLGQSVRGIPQRIAEGVAQAGGIKNESDNTSKLLETIMGEQAKSLFRDPLEQENIRSQIEARKSASDARKRGELLYAGNNENGEPIWISPPDERRVKNVSPGLMPAYQQRATAQADLARQEAELARNVGGSFNGEQSQGQPGASRQGLPPGANPNAPPGTKVNVGPYSIPVNPELTPDEARSIASIPSIQKSVMEIVQAVQGGVGNDGNMLQDAYSGMALDSGFSPATYGQDKLQGLQSSLNQLKRDTLFSDAGKALTGTERQIVERLFNVSGKSPRQIVKDITDGVKKFEEFVAAKKGGMFGYQPQAQQTPLVSDPNDIDAQLAEIHRQLQGG